jgi:AraC family transcriptional regulator
MTGMNRVMTVVQTEHVALRRFDHVPHVAHCDPERERADGHTINFVESGHFRVRTTGAWMDVTRDALFVTTPGLEFSCTHDDDHPQDACLSVAFSAGAINSATETVTLSDAAVRPLTNRHAFLYRSLRTCAPADGMRAEALGGALLASVARDTSRAPLFRPERFTWYAARVDRAKSLMEAHYDHPLTLSIVARDAGMSLFHFARVFAELEGQPPHRFLSQVRLARAHALLRDGASVTDACFACGFGSLSHFVTTFRRHFGVSPSRIQS